MGKPFRKELEYIKDTLSWVETQDVSALHDFLCQKMEWPLYCVGSGGSYSACFYATMLYREYCGQAMPITPLGLQFGSLTQFRNTKLLYVSASGNNKDILQAVKVGLNFSQTKTASICMNLSNKIDALVKNSAAHVKCNYAIPSQKDGFLATNSLVAFFGLLLRSYFPEIEISKIPIETTDMYDSSNLDNLSQYDTFLVLYSKYSEAVAFDIESKMSEAGLGAVLLSDYRNFGHGRHNWIDKRGERTCVVSLRTDVDDALAEKTIKMLPISTAVVTIRSGLDLRLAPIDLLIKSFSFVANVGDARGIDPGRPGVPSYGTLLYGLNYKSLCKSSRYSRDDLAIIRKIGVGSKVSIEAPLWTYYKEKLREYCHRLNTTEFSMVAFDYDGTLSNADRDARYNNCLQPDVKNMLLRLLSNNIRVAVLSGRGRSLDELFKKEISSVYWHLFYLGYYNGAHVRCLSEPCDLSIFHTAPLCDQLKVFADEFRKRCGWQNDIEIDERYVQLTIKSSKMTELLCTISKEIIMDKELDELYVWNSSHSIDVVNSRSATKTKVEELVSDMQILYIGDSGNVMGNDYQMLSRPFSLSVDKVSANADCCWNLLPEGVNGVEATLYYVSRFEINEGKFILKM